MSLGDPFNIRPLALRLNRDFDLDFPRFEPLVEPLLESVFNNSLYSVRRHFDLDETENGYALTLELPGFKSSDVEVTIEQNQLVVKAKRDKQSYSTSVTLPRDVDATKAEARLEDGLLRIALGKSELAKPRRIEIKSS